MDNSNKPEVRVVKGFVNEAHSLDGNPFVFQRQCTSFDHLPCALVIGDDAIPRSKVVEMLKDYEYAKDDPGAFVNRRRGEPLAQWIAAAKAEVLKKYGITNL